MKEGKVIDDTRTSFIPAPVCVAISFGAAKRYISSLEAFKRIPLDAKSIAYVKGSSSEPRLATLFERWGIGSELQ